MTFAFGDRELPGIAKVAEEAGEVIQVIGKLMMTHGMAEHWDGSNLRDRLVQELGDLGAAIEFVVKHALTLEEVERLQERMRDKRAKFEQWHQEQGEPG